MSDDRRLVYSTEQGSLEKPMSKERPGGGRKRRRPAAAAAIKKPGKQGVRIRRESKGRGGKIVSIIDGLALDQAALKQLLKQLKAGLGTGGALRDGALEIQGDHREKLLQLLEKQGISARLAGG
jgi:translation initiation factor 1